MTPKETSEHMVKVVGTYLKILIPYENWAIVIYYSTLQIRHLCSIDGYPTTHLPDRFCEHTPPDGLDNTYYLLEGR